MRTFSGVLSALPLLAFAAPGFAQQLPAAIDAPGKTAVLKAHAEGAQIYECKADAGGKLIWTFREPIASLFVDGKTVGRHYAGPNWEHVDGSTVTAKTAGNAPGASAADIPWLKLEVTAHKGSGVLAPVAVVLRINTQGGKLGGACDKAGELKSASYTADYVFLK